MSANHISSKNSPLVILKYTAKFVKTIFHSLIFRWNILVFQPIKFFWRLVYSKLYIAKPCKLFFPQCVSRELKSTESKKGYRLQLVFQILNLIFVLLKAGFALFICMGKCLVNCSADQEEDDEKKSVVSRHVTLFFLNFFFARSQWHFSI